MFVTVLLSRLLAPPEGTPPTGPALGTVYYTEAPGDSAATRVAGASVNAAIYVAFVAGVTCCIFLLFRFHFVRTIWAYMSLSGLSIFAFMGGYLALRLLQVLAVPLDALSFAFALWNFSVVGILATFILPLPLRLRQLYLVFVGVVTALWFSHLPPLTTWALLLLMALYDIAAVLCPGGPLKAIVELAQQRNTAIPALVYESRPLRRGISVAAPPAPGGEAPPVVADAEAAAAPGPVVEPAEEAGEPTASEANLEEEEEERSVKLGLGDFIFYSLLVGRASQTDLLTAAACYLGIVAGLGATLALLTLVQQALPALPLSIALGALLFVLSRWLLEPLVVSLASAQVLL